MVRQVVFSDNYVDLPDVMSTCQIIISTSQKMMSTSQVFMLTCQILCRFVVVCMALIGKEHVFKIYFLTNE